ncbi:deaminase [Tessaracoccus aquimaris]|uniref:Deaminase n=1 Tax=Tessaracoccus aquimaris TaxID=1332264 RepID=A0A1Q2CLY0_9ACTN|nr:dihydrofolate reductase family protein [Tessaracoccus aquimaris]AQP47112.1 deaminase [Tessaracoccus aquimaris]
MDTKAALLVDFITSLDGYGAGKGWPGYWGLEGPEYIGWLNAQAEKGWPIVMGGVTYRLMAGFAASGEPGVEEIMTSPKYVVSGSINESDLMPNTTVITHDAIGAVRRLKEDGISLRTLGSLTLCRSLLREGLVDRFRVGIFPVITGITGQERIYDGYPDVRLDLIESRVLDGRIQILDYRPTVV